MYVPVDAAVVTLSVDQIRELWEGVKKLHRGTPVYLTFDNSENTQLVTIRDMTGEHALAQVNGSDMEFTLLNDGSNCEDK